MGNFVCVLTGMNGDGPPPAYTTLGRLLYYTTLGRLLIFRGCYSSLPLRSLQNPKIHQALVGNLSSLVSIPALNEKKKQKRDRNSMVKSCDINSHRLGKFLECFMGHYVTSKLQCGVTECCFVRLCPPPCLCW